MSGHFHLLDPENRKVLASLASFSRLTIDLSLLSAHGTSPTAPPPSFLSFALCYLLFTFQHPAAASLPADYHIPEQGLVSDDLRSKYISSRPYDQLGSSPIVKLLQGRHFQRPSRNLLQWLTFLELWRSPRLNMLLTRAFEDRVGRGGGREWGEVQFCGGGRHIHIYFLFSNLDACNRHSHLPFGEDKFTHRFE